MPEKESKIFTAEEVNATLPGLERIVRHLQGLKREIDVKRMRLRQAKAAAGVRHNVRHDAFLGPEVELELLVLEANSNVKRIQELGGQLKDIDHGFVDFPTQVDGRDAYFCWQLGEPEVRYWHWADESSASRRPLRDKPKSS